MIQHGKNRSRGQRTSRASIGLPLSRTAKFTQTDERRIRKYLLLESERWHKLKKGPRTRNIWSWRLIFISVILDPGPRGAGGRWGLGECGHGVWGKGSHFLLLFFHLFPFFLFFWFLCFFSSVFAVLFLLFFSTLTSPHFSDHHHHHTFTSSFSSSILISHSIPPLISLPIPPSHPLLHSFLPSPLPHSIPFNLILIVLILSSPFVSTSSSLP